MSNFAVHLIRVEPGHSLLAQTHNAICLGGGGVYIKTIQVLYSWDYHASVNRISIVLMQITPQNRLHYGIVQVENK